jgi:hypothetical protein
MPSQRSLKKSVLSLLAGSEPAEILSELARHPPQSLLNALFSGICHADQLTRWHAITAMGVTAARLADQDLEAARIVIRRFMWSLNDESGGIGWGAPEAMAECLASHPALAAEYTKILVSFMREDGFYLELPALQRGLMWGIARLAQVSPELLHSWQAPRYLLPYLESADPIVCSLAARALGLLRVVAAAEKIKNCPQATVAFPLYAKHRLTTVTSGQLILEALAALATASG